MKLCIKCKYILASDKVADPECSRCGYDRPTSPITGLPVPLDRLPFCAVQLLSTSPCGLTGEKWEAAEDVMTEEEELLKGSPVFPQGEAHE